MCNRRKVKSRNEYRGAIYQKQTGKWRCQLRIEGKTRSFGTFETEVEAGMRYNEIVDQLQLGRIKNEFK